MTRIVNARGRSYRSQLREDQAELTRRRILDATLEVMAGGVASVSVPAVARHAGVAVPTIYRHFGTKQELLEAVYPHLLDRAGIEDVPPPRSLDELREGLRTLFERVDRIASLDDLARAAMTSPAAEEARRATMPRRLEITRRLASSIKPKLKPTEQERLSRLLVILTSSSALRIWRNHLGVSVEEAADDVDWVVRSAAAGAVRGTR